ncbi:hypothetical protein T11_7609 [Trichinella zimbabwensis]|uniref:Uncharacterized protein n=1 Tax=Trichinella zimbabwensis TaxID=268475 RepID=A0A0V1HJY9_9BILA|nr:hypothetical protein T11_7609 [Trichinella zimbabwensis]
MNSVQMVIMFYGNCLSVQSTCKRSYPSLLDSVSCATSYEPIASVHLLHYRLSFSLCINNQTKKGKESHVVLTCSFVHAAVPTFQIWLEATPAGSTGTRLPLDPTSQHLRFRNPRVQAKPADLPKHSLEKMEKTTLYPDVEKIALNGRYQGGFEIAYKRHQIKWDA